MVDFSDVIASAFVAFCASIPFFIVAVSVFPSSALPRHNVMNGYTRVTGTVTDSHWEYVHTDDGGYYDPVIHYNFLGTITKSNINGTTLYQFHGGHSCRGHGTPQHAKDKVNKYLQQYGAVGQTRPLFYKPPDYFHCNTNDVTLSNNFKTSMVFFSLVGLMWLCGFGIPCLVYMCEDDSLLLHCCLCIFCPITLPIYLCHIACSSSTDYIAPPHENHPFNGHYSRVSSKMSSKFSKMWIGYEDTPLSEGTKVNVKWPNVAGNLWTAVVTQRNPDGTYNVRWDSDGTSEDNVQSNRIVSYIPQGDDIILSDEPSTFNFEEGARVEADYKSLGRWYPGTITKFAESDMCNIRYDFGEDEENVATYRIRPLPMDLEAAIPATSPTSAAPSLLQAITSHSTPASHSSADGYGAVPTTTADDSPTATPQQQHPLAGKVFVQHDTVGLASYHFPNGIHGCFISYENAPADWALADGSKVPLRMEFVDAAYDETFQKFTGKIEWGQNTFGGAASFKYNFTFSYDFSRISYGTCESLDASGSAYATSSYGSFGSDLSYKLLESAATGSIELTLKG